MLSEDEKQRAQRAKRLQVWILGGGIALSAGSYLFFNSREAGASILLVILLLGVFGGRLGLLPTPERAIGRPLSPAEAAELDEVIKR